MAQRYLEEGTLPPSAEVDALHVAIASVEEMSVIVSLNMDHIVRTKTRKGTSGINIFSGYHEIEIATPREVKGYGT